MARILVTEGGGFIGHGATPSTITGAAPSADRHFVAAGLAAPSDRHAWHG